MQMLSLVIGLSKIERPILDHHAKAHIHEIMNHADFMKSGGFHVLKDPLTRNFNPMFLLFCQYKITI